MIFYGRNVVLEALRSNFNSKELFLQENIDADSKIKEIILLAENENIPITKLNKQKMNSVLKTDFHKGVGIELDFSTAKLNLKDLNLTYPGFVYISEASFEYNIGAIIRSAECAGLNGVILPKEVNINPVIARASAGALFHIPVYQESVFNAIAKFKDEKFSIFGIERGGKRYYAERLDVPALFIIGGEDKAITENVRNKCDAILEIPQMGNVNSLNMSVACSIILFERLKQVLEN